MENCVVVGRGFLYANAYEMALKLMETCYVVAERFSSPISAWAARDRRAPFSDHSVRPLRAPLTARVLINRLR